MSADLHVVGDEYAETLIECHRRWAAIGAKLIQCEASSQLATESEYAYEMAIKAEHMAMDLEAAFGRLAKLAEREE